jgi:hypothetical protein
MGKPQEYSICGRVLEIAHEKTANHLFTGRPNLYTARA